MALRESKNVNSKPLTIEQSAGIEYFTDSRGRMWRIRVFNLGEISLFNILISAAVSRGRWDVFFHAALSSPMPNIYILLRRKLGLYDFSFRYIMKRIPFKDSDILRAKIIEANLDITEEEFWERVKKNMMPILGINLPMENQVTPEKILEKL